MDKSLLVGPVSQFQHYKLGQWIRLGEAPFFCGDRSQFDIIVKDPPALTLSPWSDGNGLPGISVSLGLNVRAQVHGCLFDTAVDAAGNATALASEFSANGANLTGTFGYTLGPLHLNLPFRGTMQAPASMFNVPIQLTDQGGARLEYGSGSLSSWKPNANPKKKDVSLSVRLSTFDQFVVVDGSIGNERRPTFPDSASAQHYWKSDLPVWGPRNVGVTVRESFFGDRGAHQPGRGLLSALLPIRAKLNVKGKVLGIVPIERDLDVLLDGGAVRYVTHEGAPAVEMTLKSTEALMGGKHMLSDSGFLKSVSGRILFDRIRVDANTFKFRVADFRINADTSWFVVPVKLSSGELEKSLNGGSLDLSSLSGEALALPKCIPNAGEKFISTPGACGEPAANNGLIGFLGHLSGNRVLRFAIDPATLAVRFQEASTDGKHWKGVQASGTMTTSVGAN